MKKFDYSIKMAEDIILIDQETFKEISLSPKDLCAKMENTLNYITFVCYDKETPVGYIGLMLTTTLHYKAAWVDLIGIRPSYQSQGYGKAMLEKASLYLKDRSLGSLEFISALVRTSNFPSLKAFEKNQFYTDEKGDFKLLFKNL